MNLIDKRKLLNERPEMLNPNMNDEIKSAYNKGWNACNWEWIGLIDDDPSDIRLIDKDKLPAYDVGKVIEQLESEATLSDVDGIGKCYAIDLQTAVIIVKKGGVEE